jgi:two-component system response regulator RegA
VTELGDGRTLLLVDDDATFRDRLARALRERGLEVRGAGDHREALDTAHSFQPELALVDLRMPGAPGQDVVRDLVEAVPGIKVVVLTGYGSIATALETVRLGAVDYLTKPADADQILAAFNGNREAEEGPDTVPSLERVEWEHIQRVLSDCGGNVSQAARVLGIHRRTLQRKLANFPPQR